MSIEKATEITKAILDQTTPSPIFLIFFFVIPAIAIGLRLGSYLIYQVALVVNALPSEGNEKPKREGVSLLEMETEEPDYVVGFGDDGELIYASEKPKRKNDEVD